MNCKACRIEIEEAEGGQTFSQPAAAHVEACALCRAFRDEQSALRHMIGSLDVVAAPADFDFRLRARLAATKDGGRQRFIWNRFAPGALSMAVAASFVLLLAAGLLFKQVWLSPGADNQLQAIVKTVPLNNFTPSLAPNVAEAPVPIPYLVEVPQQTVVRRSKVSDKALAGMPEAIPSSAGREEVIGTLESGVRVAPPSITPPGIPDPVTQPTAVVAVPVQASMKSAKVMLNDGKATPQTISLKPVTFGAQDVVEQGDARKLLLKTPQGIW